MFSAVKPVVFRLNIEGFSDDLQVLEFRTKESLNQPYEVKLEQVSERLDLDLDSLLHRSTFLSFGPDGAGLHGQVYQIAQGDSGKRLPRYQMTLAPHLVYLTHCHSQRIFQHQSVPQIIAKVLKDQGMQTDAWRFQLSAEYRPRLYCVQYETDLFFLQWLREEKGLHFHFQHSADRHVLVFGDDQTVFSKPDQSTAYRQDSGMIAEAPVIDRFKLSLNTRQPHVSRRDYDFEKPRLQLDSETQPLRKLLTVELPEGLPVVLRLANAAVAQTLFGSGDQRLFGPLSCVALAADLAQHWASQGGRS